MKGESRIGLKIEKMIVIEIMYCQYFKNYTLSFSCLKETKGYQFSSPKGIYSIVAILDWLTIQESSPFE